MQTPEEVAVMRQLLERGWSQRRIARELGTSRHTVSRYQSLDAWQPYDSRKRASQLDAHQAWLQQQFDAMLTSAEFASDNIAGTSPKAAENSHCKDTESTIFHHIYSTNSYAPMAFKIQLSDHSPSK